MVTGICPLVSAFSSLIVEYFGSLFVHFQLELLPIQAIDNNPIILINTNYNSEYGGIAHI